MWVMVMIYGFYESTRFERECDAYNTEMTERERERGVTFNCYCNFQVFDYF